MSISTIEPNSQFLTFDMVQVMFNKYKVKIREYN